MTLARLQQDLPFSPVSRATIQDNVYGKLRELILNGAIEPGRTVTVQSLSEAFGCSAMPVREAMHRLVAEKALTVVAGRSVGIPSLTLERLEDLRRVRVEVEGTAATWAAGKFSSEHSGPSRRADRRDGSRQGRAGPRPLCSGKPELPLHDLPRRRIETHAGHH